MTKNPYIPTILFLATVAFQCEGQTSMPQSAPIKILEQSAPAVPVGYSAMTVDGKVVEIGGRFGDRSTVVVFLDTECPIARKSIPKLNELAVRATGKSIDFFGVVADPFTSRKKASKFIADFSVAFPVIFDASGAISVTLMPTRVPEAFLLDAAGRVVYRGRIDDEFVEIGRARTQILSHDLRDAIDAHAVGSLPAVERTLPVGCVFEAWKDAVLPIKPTYTRDIRPIVETRCVDCHRSGEVAPFALDSSDSVKKRARTIREVVHRGLMPPWRPIDSHRVFVDDPRLTDREKAIVLAWIDGAQDEGDPDDLPPNRVFPAGWSLGEPDLVLEFPEVFEIPAAGPDLIRVFVLPTGLNETRHVRAVEMRSADPSVVHHALFVTDVTGAARALDLAEPGLGYTRFGGVGFEPTGFLGGHLPGTRPLVLPDGTASRLDAGADFVLQVHYHPVGRLVREKARVGIWFARDPVEKRFLCTTVFTQDIDIPAGVSDYRRVASLKLPTDIDLSVITPHMHNVARSLIVRATDPDGQKVNLLEIVDWDFRDQRQYVFKRPVRLARGTIVELDAHYDNSTANPRNPSNPPMRVVYGDHPAAEMCMAVLGFTVQPAIEKLLDEIYPPKKAAPR